MDENENESKRKKWWRRARVKLKLKKTGNSVNDRRKNNESGGLSPFIPFEHICLTLWQNSRLVFFFFAPVFLVLRATNATTIMWLGKFLRIAQYIRVRACVCHSIQFLLCNILFFKRFLSILVLVHAVLCITAIEFTECTVQCTEYTVNNEQRRKLWTREREREKSVCVCSCSTKSDKAYVWCGDEVACYTLAHGVLLGILRAWQQQQQRRRWRRQQRRQ